MNLKEMFICGKTRDQSACEDGLVMTEELIAVIDGVTAKTDAEWDGRKPGCYAKELLEEQIYCSTVRGKDAEKYLSELDRAISRAVDRKDPGTPDNDRPKACIIIYNDIKKEIWIYGDSQYSLNGVVHAPEKRVDRLTSALRAFVIEEALQRGAEEEEIKKDDIGRRAILPFLRMQSTFENTDGPWGYPVLNGKGVNPSLITKVSVKEGDTVILASDGYPDLRPTLEESEKRLQEMLESDPLAIHGMMGTKCINEDMLSFDDRTYVRFTV